MNKLLQLLICAALSTVFTGCGNDPQQSESAVAAEAQAKTEESKTEESKTEEAKPKEAKPKEAKPKEAKTEDAEPKDAETEDAKPKEAEDVETKAVTPQSPIASDASKRSQTDKQIESDSPKTDSLLPVITIISLITAAIAISITFYLYRWRKLLLQADLSLMVPEKWGKELRANSGVIQDLATVFHQDTQTTIQHSGNLASKIQQHSEKIDQLISIFSTLQDSLNKKDEEIERLKKGYDNKIYKSFARRFIRVDKAIRENSEEPSKKDIEWIGELMVDALEEANIELFEPKIGQKYRDLGKQVADKPRVIETKESSLDFTVAEIDASGYKMLGEEESQILIPAKVAIYRFNQKEQQKEQ